jgi:hypothetical protein
MSQRSIAVVEPGTFEPERHFYTRVLNAQIHSMVRFFFSLSNDRIVRRYCHLNPTVDADRLAELLGARPHMFRWAGCDLFHVTTERGRRHMVVVETNSCPSGQKSMPLYEEHDELGGYRALIQRTFLPLLRNKRMPRGALAVLYDKNLMESSGYAAALADQLGEQVLLVPCFADDPDPGYRFDDGVLEVRHEGSWHPIRCAFRYVTQRPWTRIPVSTKTLILNPVLCCLAGGRNKAVAAKAYEFFNAELEGSGLEIRTPETIWDVSRREIPLWVKTLGDHAVVKNPYSNAGQGVYTITGPGELDAFLASQQRYDRFIVQSLIGNYKWSSAGKSGKLFHVGTIPNRSGRSYVADVRMMVSAGDDGFRPLAIYARRARQPLSPELVPGQSSWDMLGTNLSVKLDDHGGWESETNRLMLMDRKDFNMLGLSLDELIEAFVQTVLSTLAIDRMAVGLRSSRGALKSKLFRSLNDDPALIEEIVT